MLQNNSIRVFIASILCLCSFFASIAFAGNNTTVPRWVERPPFEDTQFLYYIGRASGSTNTPEAQLVRRARENAEETSIRENYGVRTSIHSQTYESAEEEDIIKRRAEISEDIVLKNFKQKDFYKQITGKQVEVFILFTYPKSEIILEQKRHKTLLEKQERKELTEIMTSTTEETGCVIIETQPSGMNFYINGISYGDSIKTPSKVCLAVGKYSIRIESPYYKQVEEQIYIEKGRTQQIATILLPARREIRIESTLPNSEVFIDNAYMGHTPLNTTVRTGEKIHIEIKNKEALPYSSHIDLGKNDSPYILYATLLKKPSYIAVLSQPAGAEVYINGKLQGKTPTAFIEVRTQSLLRISLSGYHDYEEKIDISGGTKTTLPIYTLGLVEKENPLGDGAELAQAIRRYEQEDYEGTKQALERYKHNRPLPDYKLFLYRGKVYEKEGNNEQAEKEYEYVLSYKYCSTECIIEASLEMAKLYIKIGKSSGYSISYLRKARRVSKKSPIAVKKKIALLFATIYEKERSYYDAIQEYKTLIALEPQNIQVLYALGKVQVQSTQHEEGIATLQQALVYAQKQSDTLMISKIQNMLSKYSKRMP